MIVMVCVNRSLLVPALAFRSVLDPSSFGPLPPGPPTLPAPPIPTFPNFTLALWSNGLGSRFTLLPTLLRAAFPDAADIIWTHDILIHHLPTVWSVAVVSDYFDLESIAPYAYFPIVLWSDFPVPIRWANHYHISFKPFAVSHPNDSFLLPVLSSGLQGASSNLSRLSHGLSDSEIDAVVNRPYAVCYFEDDCTHAREVLYVQLLSRLGPERVKSFGACNGSHESEPGDFMTGTPGNFLHGVSRDQLVTLMSQCVFVIAMESGYAPGFVSERLLIPFLAQSIPIYTGSDYEARQLFNPASFITLTEYSGMEAAVDDIESMLTDNLNSRLGSMLGEPASLQGYTLTACLHWTPACFQDNVVQLRSALLAGWARFRSVKK